MNKQLPFRIFDREFKKDFGGSLLKGNAKEKRPISTKRAMHLVLRSSLAKGERSFLQSGRKKQIRTLIESAAKTHGIRLYRQANSGNHLHLLILPSSRKAFQAFIRSITGLIARITLGVERGKAKSLRFWDQRPWSRIVEWGTHYQQVQKYLLQNTLEAIGFIPYQTRSASSKRQWAKGVGWETIG